MKRILLGITLTLLFSISAKAQIDTTQVKNRFDQIELQLQELKQNYGSAQKDLQELSSRDNSIESRVHTLSTLNQKLTITIDSLQILLLANSISLSNLNQQMTAQLDALSGQLSETIETTSQRVSELDKAQSKLNQQLMEQREELIGQISETRETANQSVTELDKALSKSTLYWIIAVLAVGLLSILTFVFLRKKVTDNQSSINESINTTRRELDEEAMRLDEKLIDIFNKQFEILKSNSGNNSNDNLKELALKVADRLVVMEQNLSRMDEGTKGLKQLKKGIESIKANFSSNGFEIVDLLGKPFDERDKRIEPVIFKTDENLNSEERIISRIIKPLINFNQEPIQNAQVEVSQGE